MCPSTFCIHIYLFVCFFGVDIFIYVAFVPSELNDFVHLNKKERFFGTPPFFTFLVGKQGKSDVSLQLICQS